MTDSPLRQQPPGVPPGRQSPLPPPPRKLSTTITLGTLGALTLVLTFGMVVASQPGVASGGVMLAAGGFCALIIAGVLAYAALNRIRPGWLLPVSIVGAVALIPLTGLAGLRTGAVTGAVYESGDMYGVFDEATDLDYDYGFGLETTTVEGPAFAELTTDQDGIPLPVIGRQATEINLIRESLLLDLTNISGPWDHYYSISAQDGAHLVVLVRADREVQVTLDAEGTSHLVGVTQLEAVTQDTRLETTWINGPWDFTLADMTGDADDYMMEDTLSISLDLQHSNVLFVQVPDNKGLLASLPGRPGYTQALAESLGVATEESVDHREDPQSKESDTDQQSGSKQDTADQDN